MLVSISSKPILAFSSQISTPARLPVVTEFHVSSLLSDVSLMVRPGLRKFTGTKRVICCLGAQVSRTKSSHDHDPGTRHPARALARGDRGLHPQKVVSFARFAFRGIRRVAQ